MSDKPVSIYFSGVPGQLAKDDNVTEYKDYIIKQNDYYHLLVQKLEREVSNLEKINEDLEQENETLETSKQSLKSYVKNEHEINVLYRNVIEHYDAKINEFNKIDAEFERKRRFYGILTTVLVALNIPLMYFVALNQFLLLIVLIMSGGLVFELINIYSKDTVSKKNIIKDVNNELVLKWKHEIERGYKGNRYLDELIDKF